MNTIPGLQYKSLFAHSDRQLPLDNKAAYLSWMSGRMLS